MKSALVSGCKNVSNKIGLTGKAAFLIAVFILSGNLIASATGITNQLSKLFYWPTDEGVVAGEYTVHMAINTPSSPKWIFEPWIWEDTTNTQASTEALVDGYSSRNIPFGVIIIDSPWETKYNNFIVDTSRYPNMKGMIDDFHSQGKKVLFWITNYVNRSDTNGDEGVKSTNYDEACQGSNGYSYFIESTPGNCATFEWRGNSSAIDYFNPDAVSWWHKEMDKAINLGIDGWKVDGTDYRAHLDPIQTRAGDKSNKEYNNAMYRDFRDYIKSKKSDAIIFSRAFAEHVDNTHGNNYFSPADTCDACNFGDQEVASFTDARGITDYLYCLDKSVAGGYSAVGSDIGGYNFIAAPGDKNLFIRWAQL
ncbi:MAG TPA: glycoside hydrolase family 31 protein, partial [Patescibacteria group bacterium]|nr:glycoside hydrolase family 31 protein [Patescibacteria group bacterium]